MKTLILGTAASILMAGSALAHEYTIGDLVIDHPVTRATPANAPVSGGYMVIRNTGDQADRLIGGSAPFAGMVEIHEMAMDGDVMKMRELDGGLEIPAGGEVMLKPGGYHVMFMQLNERLVEGAEYDGTLVFEKAGTVDVTFNVEGLTEIRERMGADGDMKMMDHSNHEHGHNHGD